MGLKSEEQPEHKKTVTKKMKNNSGTFNLDNPKKPKKVSAVSEKDDVSKMKRRPKVDKIVGMEVGDERPKKRRVKSDEATEEPLSKKSKFSPSKKGNFKGSRSGKQFGSKPSYNGQTSEGKPDWNKLKEEKKALREKRRAAQREGDSYEVSIEAKKIFEAIRVKKCTPAEQSKQLKNLHSMLKGKLLMVVYAHDMSRVIETIIKLAHANKQFEIVKEVALELLPEIVDMSKRRYSTYAARAVVSHVMASERSKIAEAFSGRVLQMLNHKLGSAVIEELYSKMKPTERHALQKELYGPTYKLVASEPVTGLDVICRVAPTMKESTLHNTKETLTSLFAKSIVESHMIHTTLLDYLSFASPEESDAMLELARDHIKALCKSREGVHVAMMCVWMGAVKARKKIIKQLQGGIVSLACGEHTHLLLLAIFDSVDDTVFVNKAILTELISRDLAPLLSSKYGRKVLGYLCCRRDPHMFTAPVVATLSAGDANPHSKKDTDTRASELQQYAVPHLLTHISENTSQWMEENSNLTIMLPILKAGSGGKLQDALQAVAKYVVNPSSAKNGEIDIRIADNPGCHMILKKLAEHDKVFAEKGHATFGDALVQELTDAHYQVWLKNNRCCFLLLGVLKNSSDETVRELQSKIKKLSTVVWKSKNAIPVGGQKLKEHL